LWTSATLGSNQDQSLIPLSILSLTQWPSSNDWTNKAHGPQVVFPGLFFRLLWWIWTLCITYPDTAILLGDNDITGAFRLIKYNPWVVSMHGIVVHEFLGLATGQTFEDTASPGNFEVAAIARQQHAAYLWAHKSNEVLQRAHEFVQQMSFHTGSHALAFAPANKDSRNRGVLNADGHRMPPPFPHQVDDCMFADVPEHMPLTAAASMVALEDSFGEKHPCQEHVLSFDKLNLSFDENTVMLLGTTWTRGGWWWASPYAVKKRLSTSLSPKAG
jgi:hypothetical protein